jgi:hypothetical protein
MSSGSFLIVNSNYSKAHLTTTHRDRACRFKSLQATIIFPRTQRDHKSPREDATLPFLRSSIIRMKRMFKNAVRDYILNGTHVEGVVFDYFKSEELEVHSPPPTSTSWQCLTETKNSLLGNDYRRFPRLLDSSRWLHQNAPQHA